MKETFCTKQEFVKYLSDLSISSKVPISTAELNFERFCWLYKKDTLKEAEAMFCLYTKVIQILENNANIRERKIEEVSSSRSHFESMANGFQKQNERLHVELREAKEAHAKEVAMLKAQLAKKYNRKRTIKKAGVRKATGAPNATI